jgi:hypothetical protein
VARQALVPIAGATVVLRCLEGPIPAGDHASHHEYSEVDLKGNRTIISIYRTLALCL